MYCAIAGVTRLPSSIAMAGVTRVSSAASCGASFSDFCGSTIAANASRRPPRFHARGPCNPQVAGPESPANRLFRQLLADQFFEVAVVERRTVSRRELEVIEDAERLANVHRAAFRIERAVRGKDDLVEVVERHAGLRRRLGGKG